MKQKQQSQKTKREKAEKGKGGVNHKIYYLFIQMVSARTAILGNSQRATVKLQEDNSNTR